MTCIQQTVDLSAKVKVVLYIQYLPVCMQQTHDLNTADRKPQCKGEGRPVHSVTTCLHTTDAARLHPPWKRQVYCDTHVIWSRRYPHTAPPGVTEASSDALWVQGSAVFLNELFIRNRFKRNHCVTEGGLSFLLCAWLLTSFFQIIYLFFKPPLLVPFITCFSYEYMF